VSLYLRMRKSQTCTMISISGHCGTYVQMHKVCTIYTYILCVHLHLLE